MKNIFIGICVLGMILLLALGVLLSIQTQPKISKSVNVILNITPSVDFTLTADPVSITTPVGRNVAYTISVVSVNDFAGDIVFSISGPPEGVTAAFLPSNTLTLGAGETKGIQIDLSIPQDNALVGEHALTITAESEVYN
jgi:uncharacterized membrane protein